MELIVLVILVAGPFLFLRYMLPMVAFILWSIMKGLFLGVRALVRYRKKARIAG